MHARMGARMCENSYIYTHTKTQTDRQTDRQTDTQTRGDSASIFFKEKRRISPNLSHCSLHLASYHYAQMTCSCVDVYCVVAMVIGCVFLSVLRALEVFRLEPQAASYQQQWLNNDSRLEIL